MNKLVIIPFLIFVFNSQAQSNIYNRLKDSVNITWITPLEQLENTKPSYFNKTNSQLVFISPLEISGYGTPFSNDCDLSVLKFLSPQDSTIVVNTGKEADSFYLGTKIKWKEKIPALLYINSKIKNSSITDWYLFGKSECPKFSLFPTLNFEELYQLDSPEKNDSEGIALFPSPNDISIIKEATVELKSKTGNRFWGKAYDLNNDEIQDVFIYRDTDYDSNGKRQQKLYINVEGKWVIKWNNLEETRCF
jgi:hypothetical protein